MILNNMSIEEKSNEQNIKVWEKPEIEVLGNAKQLIEANFSALFDQKNSSASVDQFNANIS
jgi:hypothetical protein